MNNLYYDFEIQDEVGFFLFKKGKTPELSEIFLETFSETFDQIDENKKLKFLVFKNITSSNVFFDQALSNAEILRLLTKWEKTLRYLGQLPQVSIVTIEGEVVGPALQFMLACDFRIAEKNAVFLFKELENGVLPGMEVYRLTKLLGPSMAEKILLIEGKADSAHAKNIGLIDYCVDRITDEEIFEIIKGVQGKNTTAIDMTKRLISESLHDSYEDALGHYLAAQSRCLAQLLKGI